MTPMSSRFWNMETTGAMTTLGSQAYSPVLIRPAGTKM